MADQKLVDLFLSDKDAWERWRNENPEGGFDFAGVDFRDKNLPGSYLIGGNFFGADFRGANLSGSRFEGAYCHGAKFDGANLAKVNFLEAGLTQASFNSADLSNAVLVDTRLAQTSFVRAILRGARLEKAQLVQTDFTGADLSGCRVYGISAWDVVLDDCIQTDLEICKDLGAIAPTLVVDTLELAQFLYLMLSNEKLRHVIDMITSKVVLILGRFAPPYKDTLDSLRIELRRRGFVPVLFDFDKPTSRDFTETVSLLGHMSRFIVADISSPRSVPHELASLVPRLLSVPVQPLLHEDETPYGMFEDIKRYSHVLPVKHYRRPFDPGILDDVIITLSKS